MKKNIHCSLTKNLHNLLKEEGINQRELATKAKVNKSTLHGYLNGVTPKNIVTLKRIAIFFGISLDELLFGEKVLPDKTLKKLNQKKYEVIVKAIE